MRRENRFVFDADVIVSALLFHDSVPGQAFFRALDCGVFVMSPQLVEELWDVLSRDKFDRYLAREDRERLLAGLVQDAENATIAECAADRRTIRPRDLSLSLESPCSSARAAATRPQLLPARSCPR